jgi:hypothetical protein
MSLPMPQKNTGRDIPKLLKKIEIAEEWEVHEK